MITWSAYLHTLKSRSDESNSHTHRLVHTNEYTEAYNDIELGLFFTFKPKKLVYICREREKERESWMICNNNNNRKRETGGRWYLLNVEREREDGG